MMKFKATTSTADGRLTKGKIYRGTLSFLHLGLRIVVFDDKKQWMSFNPKVFLPGDRK